MLHATLRSLKNSGALGTHAAVYGLSSLCVTLHPAQSVTTILQPAVPARPPVRPADPIEPNARSLTDSRVALHGPRVSLAPCGRPSHNVEKAQRQKDVWPGCACGPRSAGLLAQVGKDALLLGGDGVLGLLELDLGRGYVASHGGLKSLSVRLRGAERDGHSAALSGTQRHAASLSVTQRHSAALSVSDPKGTPKQHPPAARPRRSCKSP